MSNTTGKNKGGGFLAGLRNGLSPMLNKEMRSRTRGWRSPVLLTVYLGLMSVGAVGFVWLNMAQGSTINPQMGLSFYGILVFGLVLLLSFIAPAVAASSISGERERRTYDLLLSTGASLTGIVLGKWLASVAYLLFLVLAALPLLALVFLFGGVPPSTMLMAVLVCLLTGLGYGALGLCLSAVLKRSQAATIVSLVLVFLLIFGTPIAAGIAASNINNNGYAPEYYGAEVQQPGVPWYLFMSPLSALTDAMPGAGEVGMGRGVPLISSIMNELMRQFQPRMNYEYAMKASVSSSAIRGASGPTTGGVDTVKKPGLMASWPYWARFALHQGILVIVSLLVAIAAITPRKPWHIWRARKNASGA